MIVVMKRGASPEQIQHVIQRIEEFGLKAHPIYGTERTVVAAVGEKRDEHRHSLEIAPGVAEVVPILAPYKVASIEVKPERTVVRVGPLWVGNCHLGVIAGPCAVESEEQTVATARAVKAAGATALRGGALSRGPARIASRGSRKKGSKSSPRRARKPACRSSPRSSPRPTCALVARYADVLQIGARNMQNYRLLGRGRGRRASRCC